MSNFKKNIKEFIIKYKIVLGIFVFLIISFGIYLYASAEEDPYANKIEVKNPTILVTDGTPNVDGNFDANDDAGNDSSGKNGRVRNFDSIIYEINYNLGSKSEADNAIEGSIRNVIVDVLLPETVNASVAYGAISNPLQTEAATINIDGISYKYYKIDTVQGQVSSTSTSKFDLYIKDINMPNNSQISPIIRIRESTDLNYSDFSNESTTSDLTSNVLTVEQVTVTSIDQWRAKLFAGASVPDATRTTSSLPIGIVIYIPFDSNKGIKGCSVPSTLDLNLNITSTPTDKSTLAVESIDDYKSSGTTLIGGMLEAYDKNNGEINVDNIISENGTYTLHYTGLTYASDVNGDINDTDGSSILGKYISSKILKLTSTRSNGVTEDINYTISGTNVIGTIIIDNYEEIVGNYKSEVKFKNSSSSNESIVEANSATYNYGEEFYVENDITYGDKVGDTLDNGFVNYLKIDNTAIKLLDINNASYETKDYSISMPEGFDADKIKVEYGVGEWTADYFSKKSDAPSYCPNLSGLTKEQLMNYYGGPCIEENSAKVTWYNSLSEASSADSSNLDNIIIVKTTVSDSISTGTVFSVNNKVKVKDDSKLSGNTYQITARGLTTFNNETFYMSNPDSGIPVNVSKQASDISYTKMTYDKGVIGNDSSSGQNGNSILVTNAKLKIKKIDIKDKNDTSDRTIYAGVNDPLQIEISPSIEKNIGAIFSDVNVDVYLPKTLAIDVQTGDKNYVGTPKEDTYTVDGETLPYVVYTYHYTADEIKSSDLSASGTIPTLIIHANVSLTAKGDKGAIGSTIYARVWGNIKIDGEEHVINNPEKDRIKSKDVALYNNNSIGLLGTTSPTYIDNNGSYTYNVKAYNLSASAASIDLLYVLPFNGDGLSVEYGSSFKGTIKSSIDGTLPTGYTAYYTTENAETVLTNEVSSSANVDWKVWTNYNSELSNVTAIKISTSNNINYENYFAGESGITFRLSTVGNKEADIYYNNFYVLHKNASVCQDTNAGDECTETSTGLMIYSSNITSSSVYNRTVSGKVFIDDDYNGFSSDEEERVGDIAVDLYKTTASINDAKDPLSVVKDDDIKVLETTTNSDGIYNFSGLTAGSYYVKYTFDCEKYTVTEKNKTDETNDTNSIDSDAVLISGTCSAVSNIITLSNDTINATNIDLGLRLRQVFDVSVDKYITNVTVTSTKGVESHDYDHAKQVKLDLKNLKNTSFRVTYTIELENTKYFPGTVGYILETIPTGMTFDPTITGNEGWTENGGYLYYTELSSLLLVPGEKNYITIILDLVTDSGGDYVNFVAVDDLQIQSLTSDFTEVVDENEYKITEEEPSEEEMSGGDQSE